MGTQKNRLIETILLSTHNIGLEGQIRIKGHAKCPLSRVLKLYLEKEKIAALPISFKKLPAANALRCACMGGKVTAILYTVLVEF